MSSVASRCSTICSARRSRSCEVGTSPSRIAVAAWKRKRRAPSYSITTSRSGGAVSTALSRYACGEAAKFMLLMALPGSGVWVGFRPPSPQAAIWERRYTPVIGPAGGRLNGPLSVTRGLIVSRTMVPLTEAAHQLGADERTLRRAVATGTVRCHERSPRRRQLDDDEIAYLSAHW